AGADAGWGAGSVRRAIDAGRRTEFATTMSDTNPEAADEEHRRKMAKMQVEMKARMKAADDRRGLIIVNTGHGKGKSTAAFGLLARTLAHGGRAVVVQFIKATPDA